jgi:hypothetical protein
MRRMRRRRWRLLRNKKMKIFNLYLIVILTGFILSSCDPMYSVSISNNRNDTVTIEAKTTVNFSPLDTLIAYERLGGTYDHAIIRFKMAPKTSIEIGQAIAGIEDDMPFTKLKIYSVSDSIYANSQEQILNLFKKTFFGNLETPYELDIK